MYTGVDVPYHTVGTSENGSLSWHPKIGLFIRCQVRGARNGMQHGLGCRA